TAAGLTAAALLGLAFMHRQLLVVGFDRRSARPLGGRPLLADLSLLALVAAATLIAVRGLGNLLVAAVLVAPAATAQLLTRRLLRMMALAIAVAALCSIAGLYLSYYASTAGGASVASLLVVAYLSVRVIRREASGVGRAEMRFPIEFDVVSCLPCCCFVSYLASNAMTPKESCSPRHCFSAESSAWRWAAVRCDALETQAPKDLYIAGL